MNPCGILAGAFERKFRTVVAMPASPEQERADGERI
jgi:hypothetical protein